MTTTCRQFVAMGGHNEVQVCTETAEKVADALDQVEKEVARLEQKYSRYRPDSLLSRVNAAAGFHATPLDVETFALLQYADACYQASDGLFDITSGVLRHAWNFNAIGVAAQIPEQTTLLRALDKVGWGKVKWNAESIFLEREMELDLGGVVKEYAADRACQVLASAGIFHGFVNLAGDVRVLGPQAVSGTTWQNGQALATAPWSIGIAHPRRSSATVCTVMINQGALATSGDYERYIEVDGKRYCHILDPRTGMPADHWWSVSVIAPLCLAAGSASTVGLLKGAQAPAFLRAHGLSFLAFNGQAQESAGAFGESQIDVRCDEPLPHNAGHPPFTIHEQLSF
jgi:FAD:protein FMN transferase